MGLKWIFLGFQYQFGLELEFWNAVFDNLLLLLSNYWEITLDFTAEACTKPKNKVSNCWETKLKTLFFWGFQTRVSKFRFKTDIEKTEKLNFWFTLKGPLKKSPRPHLSTRYPCLPGGARQNSRSGFFLVYIMKSVISGLFCKLRSNDPDMTQRMYVWANKMLA